MRVRYASGNENPWLHDFLWAAPSGPARKPNSTTGDLVDASPTGLGSSILKSTTEAILDPITKAYRTGGLALALLVLGAFLMVAATLVPERWLTIALVATGFILVMAVCALFFVKELRPLARAQRATQQNRDLIDGIQRASIELTGLALDLQALAFKNSQQIDAALTAMLPIVDKVPRLGPMMADSGIALGSNTLSQQIVLLTQGWQKVVSELQDSLVSSDPAKLQKYVKELVRIRAAVTDLLVQDQPGKETRP